VDIDVAQLRPVEAEISFRFFADSEKAILARLSGRHWLDAFLTTAGHGMRRR
jgi:hypothetical protein